VEGREAGTGEIAPENEQATTAQPEAAREAKTGEGQESTPKTGWTPEERAAAINAERERREAREAEERERGDDDPGREMT
jgi:hypothetical protein